MSGDTETAILAGGCAWIMQQLLRHPGGVISTRVGWSGGEGEDPTEESPRGHAEAVEVVFDPDGSPIGISSRPLPGPSGRPQ